MATTPSTTWGTSTLRPLKPNSLALTTWIQSATGGLSNDTKPAGSKELKKKLCRLSIILRTPAV